MNFSTTCYVNNSDELIPRLQNEFAQIAEHRKKVFYPWYEKQEQKQSVKHYSFDVSRLFVQISTITINTPSLNIEQAHHQFDLQHTGNV